MTPATNGCREQYKVDGVWMKVNARTDRWDIGLADSDSFVDYYSYNQWFVMVVIMFLCNVSMLLIDQCWYILSGRETFPTIMSDGFTLHFAAAVVNWY